MKSSVQDLCHKTLKNKIFINFQKNFIKTISSYIVTYIYDCFSLYILIFARENYVIRNFIICTYKYSFIQNEKIEIYIIFISFISLTYHDIQEI